MDERLLLSAIREDPEDEGRRLAFAQWLEEHGQGERAEWIRASCEYAKVRYEDERWEAMSRREREAFARCRPVWFEWLTNIEQRNDRGVFVFGVGGTRSSRSPTPVKRLGKVPWLGDAYDEGWLLRIELLWDDGSLGKLVAGWKEPASRVPLFVRPAPQMGDEGLRQLLRLPQLIGLDLLSHVLRNPVVKELGEYPGLTDLTVEFRLVESGIVDAVLEQIVMLPGLRRLQLKGHEQLKYGNRPNDDDLARLRDAPALRRLYLSSSPGVTDVGIEVMREGRPDFIITHGG